jgi:hypothetical protein
MGWMKVDPLWSAIIRLGLMPYARELFARTLAVETRPVARVRGSQEAAPALAA